VRRLGPDVVRVSYPACRSSSEVVLYRVEGGGHTWPGGVQYLPSFVIGPTSRSVSASEAIWRFFARHHR
jgi:polyhydroxybutyrate depolymerase